MACHIDPAGILEWCYQRELVWHRHSCLCSRKVQRLIRAPESSAAGSAASSKYPCRRTAGATIGIDVGPTGSAFELAAAATAQQHEVVDDLQRAGGDEGHPTVGEAGD